MAEAADSSRNVEDSIDAGRGELLKVLLRHEVKFVVIGGAAIQSHGRRYVTEDIDLTPDTEEANLQRLANDSTSSSVGWSPIRPIRAAGSRCPRTTSRRGRCSRLPSGTSRHAMACSTSASLRAASPAATPISLRTQRRCPLRAHRSQS